MDADYIQPKFKLDGFNCPHCGAYAHQTWHYLWVSYSLTNNSPSKSIEDMTVSNCNKCHTVSIWLNNAMIYPFRSTIPLPSEDMPQDVKTLYFEARNVMIFSPRASAAILRLAVETLMPHLDAKGNDLNDKIGFLVKNGLDKKIQEALDSIRVIGNNAVHPGQISIDDNPTIAAALFNLLNIIVTSTITRDKQIQEVHDLLPTGAKEAIKKRDS